MLFFVFFIFILFVILLWLWKEKFDDNIIGFISIIKFIINIKINNYEFD